VYRRLTELHLKLDSRTESAAAWVEASRAFTKAGNTTGEASGCGQINTAVQQGCSTSTGEARSAALALGGVSCEPLG
jgi:hypothetical protein